MHSLGIEEVFWGLIDRFNVLDDEFWMTLIQERKIQEINRIAEIIDNISKNRGDLNNPDLVWILDKIVQHMIFYVYGKTTTDVDEAIMRMTRLAIKNNKNVVFIAYSSHVFKGRHKEVLIEDIINCHYTEELLDQYITEFCCELDINNSWMLIALLYDFRDDENELLKWEDEFWIAADFIEEDCNAYEDFRFLFLTKFYLSKKRFVIF